MKLTIRHQVSLSLPEGTARAVEHLLLTPRTGPTQSVTGWHIEMPGIEDAVEFADAYGNQAHLVTQTKPETQLVVVASGQVETLDRNGVLGRPKGEPMPALFLRATDLARPVPELVAELRESGTGRIALLHELMARTGPVLEDVEPEAEPPGPEQSASAADFQQSQTLGGMTQSQGPLGETQVSAAPDQAPPEAPTTAIDMAHAFVGTARALGIPARFVTGYLVAEDEGPATFHAWAEAFDEGLGWIAFDPSLNLCPTERHVRVAIGLDALSTVPVRSVPEAEGRAPDELVVEVAAPTG